MTKDELIATADDACVFTNDLQVVPLKYALQAIMTARESCAKIADDRVMRCEAKVVHAEDEDEKINLRSLAWQFSVLADEMRKRSNVKVSGARND